MSWLSVSGRLWLWRLAGVIGSAALLGGYAAGGSAHLLGFIALVPWLLSLERERTLLAVLGSGLLMSAAFVIAAFAWFGGAIDHYLGLGPFASELLLVVMAPLLQPQLLAFALTRHALRAHYGPVVRALAAASAWIGCEWWLPKLLGDTLGHGLSPSPLLRQAADLGGAAGLTLVLILVNEGVVRSLTEARAGWRRWAPSLLSAAVLPAILAGYGAWRLADLRPWLAAPAPSLRVGMVQSAIVDYERLREEHGAYAVVRQVLDTHYAMSDYAIREQGVDALLWAETVYPTPFGHAKSADGAALDEEILAFVRKVGVPLVFGTYDADVDGEYNAAAFLDPQRGLLGYYRKSFPFPFTESVPAWLEGAWLRRQLPWAGSWRPGSGARVFPLRAGDGREVNVLPLICLDDVHSALAVDGARLGAQAIVGLSNDSWFSRNPAGARLHLGVATFRSIETRLPQLRVTNNGLSALVDETGTIVARTEMGQQAVLVGELPLRDPAATVLVRWGDWLGPACLILLAVLASSALLRAVGRGRDRSRTEHATTLDHPADYRANVVLLTPTVRAAASLLRIGAGLGLLWLGLRMLLRDGLQMNSIDQLVWFVAAVASPVFAAWVVQHAFRARARSEGGTLVLELRDRRIELTVSEIARLLSWRVPLPGSGLAIEFGSGRRWSYGLRVDDPDALQCALAAAGSPARWADDLSARLARHAGHRARARRRWLDHAAIKFALFPLVPALPAFRLHQYIAYGGTLGEYYTYGLGAWVSGLLIWWLAWAAGLMLYAALLRCVIELLALPALLGSGERAATLRRGLEWTGRVAFYVGPPAWLALRILSP